ncbi:uncharacterized protein isoform X2 [Choristoneura fumiferana]|uniref:uncharacterized protein isoform X2 n=1 Tax=Choristoneura fumiferana TaxID=7141 RepID=UPI003D157116
MSSIKLAEYVLWKSIKHKRKDEFSTREYNSHSLFLCSKIEENVFPEMICRVCTCPADIPVTDTINGINIIRTISSVTSIYVSNLDPCLKYICKNCLDELKIALDFKKKCESSDYNFRQTQPQRIDKCSRPMVMHDFALIIHQMTRRRLVRLTGTDGRGHNNRIKLNISYLQKPNEVIEARARKAIKCQQCDLAFGTKDLLIEHRLQQNCVCPPCPQCGKLVSNLARHKKNVHLRTDEFTCHICD